MVFYTMFDVSKISEPCDIMVMRKQIRNVNSMKGGERYDCEPD